MFSIERPYFYTQNGGLADTTFLSHPFFNLHNAETIKISLKMACIGEEITISKFEKPESLLLTGLLITVGHRTLSDHPSYLSGGEIFGR